MKGFNPTFKNAARKAKLKKAKAKIVSPLQLPSKSAKKLRQDAKRAAHDARDKLALVAAQAAPRAVKGAMAEDK